MSYMCVSIVISIHVANSHCSAYQVIVFDFAHSIIVLEVVYGDQKILFFIQLEITLGLYYLVFKQFSSALSFEFLTFSGFLMSEQSFKQRLFLSFIEHL